MNWKQKLKLKYNNLEIDNKEQYKKKDDRPIFYKSKIREWTDAIIFAVFAATIIRTFIFEAYVSRINPIFCE